MNQQELEKYFREKYNKDFSADGTKEVFYIYLPKIDKKCVLAASFEDIIRGYNIFMKPKFDVGNENKNVSVDIDFLGAGSKLLFWGGVSGVEDYDEIIKKPRYRLAAAQQVSNWFAEIVSEQIEDEDEPDSKKK